MDTWLTVTSVRKEYPRRHNRLMQDEAATTANKAAASSTAEALQENWQKNLCKQFFVIKLRRGKGGEEYPSSWDWEGSRSSCSNEKAMVTTTTESNDSTNNYERVTVGHGVEAVGGEKMQGERSGNNNNNKSNNNRRERSRWRRSMIEAVEQGVKASSRKSKLSNKESKLQAGSRSRRREMSKMSQRVVEEDFAERSCCQIRGKLSKKNHDLFDRFAEWSRRSRASLDRFESLVLFKPRRINGYTHLKWVKPAQLDVNWLNWKSGMRTQISADNGNINQFYWQKWQFRDPNLIEKNRIILQRYRLKNQKFGRFSKHQSMCTIDMLTHQYI